MDVVRRVYFYVVAAVSLSMLVGGIANLGSTVIDIVAGNAIERSARASIATSVALILVGLPIWAIHWSLANRSARANEVDRRSSLRRLYLYGTAGALLLAFAILGSNVVQVLLHTIAQSGRRVDGVDVARYVWLAAVALAFWIYQLRTATRDRSLGAEVGGSATIRRWYTYVVQMIALLTILFAARELLRTIARSIVQPAQIARDQATVDTIGTILIALLIWAYHLRWSSTGAVGEEDRPSTLRAVHGFLVLSISVGLTLFDASQMLYYALARALGVARPGGIEGDLASVLVDPVTTIVAFGGGWALMRMRLQRDAEASTRLPVEQRDPRRDGVRRLYTHLVSLIALIALASGLTGVLWTISDQLIGVQPAAADAWRDQISLAVTLIVVGLLVWLGHWRPAPAVEEERETLSRRLYLFAALLLSVLGLLGSGATLVYSLLSLVIEVPGASTSTIGRALAASLVAFGVGGYHWRVLRADLAARRSAPFPQIEEAAPTPARATIVEIVGASEEEIRRALAGLPSDATYSLRGTG